MSGEGCPAASRDDPSPSRDDPTAGSDRAAGPAPAPPPRCVEASAATTALLTDRYELTMLDAALRAGRADVPATFEVFSRRLPPGRPAGVLAGIGRVLDAVERYRFAPAEIEWLRSLGFVAEETLAWLEGYHFSGSIDAYPEGDWYAPGSPVLSVEGTFGEAVILETVILSILNFDSAVASAASLLVAAAGGRPVIEMGSRRTDPDAAVAAARAAYLAGFTSTSNLEAGRRHGLPTAGTAAHSFVLAFPGEEEAFAAQVEAMGPGTTLLVDTFDVDSGIRRAVAAAGPRLGGIRIDSGDLDAGSRRARALLDSLGATATRIVVTGDLDDRAITALADAPVDVYGVGTNVVTGLGAPSAGFVYKLVAIGSVAGGPQRPVAKLSPGKGNAGGRKRSWRVDAATPEVRDVVGPAGATAPYGGRPLPQRVMDAGADLGRVELEASRAWHARVRAEIPAGAALGLERLEPGPGPDGR